MLSLLKTKYYLKDLLPENYIDIHNHLLPGIDDGAKTIEETDYLIMQMKSLNIVAAIATPHTFNGLWDNTSTSIENAYKIAIENNQNKLFLKRYASEYMLDVKLIEKVKNEPLLCLFENYILIEFHLFNYPINLYEMLFELKLKNYKMIIAHPERYLYFHNSINKYKKLKDFGVYFQLNLLSLTGYYGKAIQSMAETLLQNDLYDFTGTDIHNENQIKYLESKPIQIVDKKKMNNLLNKNSLFF